jgi:enamine deaminase RidA (YjgF/YER057c/UK114 family)
MRTSSPGRSDCRSSPRPGPALGSLDRITGTIKVLGMVNSDPSFERHPMVINGCSDLLVEVLGEAGRHTRSAVGFVSLPNSISVEIEAAFVVQ